MLIFFTFFFKLDAAKFLCNVCLLSEYILNLVQVREQPNQPKQGQQKIEASPFIAELLQLEEQAKTQGLGRWSKVFIY